MSEQTNLNRTAIDLRSDTVTRPTPAMLAAMASAPTGDDVYGEDPTVTDLERHTAGLLGHEAGLFCPTGSMSNLLGVWLSVTPGREVLCDAGAHIARAEMGAHGALHGVTMRTWTTGVVAAKVPGRRPGVAEVGDVEPMLVGDGGPFLVSTDLVCLENTHNFAGGTIQPIDNLRAIAEVVKEREIALHLDGARLWNAHIATAVPLADYGKLFDTVSVCFSKGLGAPVGSVLVGSAQAIAAARVQRKRLGGGMRQVGVLAAACRYALDNHLAGLAMDHRNAARFAQHIAAESPAAINAEPQTNIVLLHTGDVVAAELAHWLAQRGVLISAMAPRLLRAVTHRDVTDEDCQQAARLVVQGLRELAA